MSLIDKFGRGIGARCYHGHTGPRGPQGIGFNLTSGKHYDIQSKQLKNVGEPTDERDGTTVKFVNDAVNVCKEEILTAASKLLSDHVSKNVTRNKVMELEFKNLMLVVGDLKCEMYQDIDKLKQDIEKSTVNPQPT